MKRAQKFLATVVLGLSLLAVSANAEESGGSVVTNMDSTRLSGYVSSTANWQSHSPGVHPLRRWFEATFHRLRWFLWQ
jgi:hypothetical protein